MMTAQTNESTKKPEVGAELYNTHLEEFLQAYKDDPERAFKRFGFAYVHSLPPHERLALYEAHKWVPGEAADVYNLGTVALQQEDLETCRKLYTKALKKDPGHYETLYNMSVLCQNEGDTKKAKAFAQRALEVAPEEDMEAIEAFLMEGEPKPEPAEDDAPAADAPDAAATDVAEAPADKPLE